MDVSQAIQLRKSVRAYQDKEIENEKLNKVLEAARLAPSASNRQEWKFIVVKDKDTKEKNITHTLKDHLLRTKRLCKHLKPTPCAT